MKSIFILYMPGHAGNFLTRLFSLSPETIPQMPIHVLKESVIETGKAPVINDRADYYSFSQAKQYGSWQKFHRAWPDFYNYELFNYLNDLYTPQFSHVVFSIHPAEFLLFEDSICKTNYEFYYVDTDEQLLPWISCEQKLRRFKYRPDYQHEFNDFNMIKQKYNMKPINLLNIVTGANFVSEYKKVTQEMNITADVPSATQLYNEWHQIRGPK
jgi:hypothetical protein